MNGPDQVLGEIVAAFIFLKYIVRAVFEDGCEACLGVAVSVYAAVDDLGPFGVVPQLEPVVEALNIGCTAVPRHACWRRYHMSYRRTYIGWLWVA